jgi:hypothetical protein
VKKIGIVSLICAAAMALAAASALAGNGNGKSNGNGSSSPSADQLASSQCVAQKHAIGNKEFKALYGKRAMKTCKGKNSGPARSTIASASAQCKAEQADPNFAATHNGATFDQFYGTNPNDKNGFGKCVSGKTAAAAAAQQAAVSNAAITCRTERSDPAFAAAHEGKSFTDFYGTNKKKRNAFGKCVSGKAKAAPAPAPAVA